MWHCNDCNIDFENAISASKHRIETGHHDIDKVFNIDNDGVSYT